MRRATLFANMMAAMSTRPRCTTSSPRASGQRVVGRLNCRGERLGESDESPDDWAAPHPCTSTFSDAAVRLAPIRSNVMLCMRKRGVAEGVALWKPSRPTDDGKDGVRPLVSLPDAARAPAHLGRDAGANDIATGRMSILSEWRGVRSRNNQWGENSLSTTSLP